MIWGITSMLGFNIFSGDDWMKLFNKLFLWIMIGLCYVIYFVEEVFFTLITGFKDAEGKTTLNLIDVIINGTVVQRIILGCLVAGAILIFLFAIISIIKQYSSYKEEPNNRMVLADTIKGILVMVAIPLIVYGMILLVNGFSDAMVDYLGGGPRTVNTSIANHLFYCLGKWKQGLSINNVCFSMGAEELVEKCFDEPTNIGSYQYIIGYIVAFILMFNLGKATLIAGKRIFDIALLYGVAPLTASPYPLDHGSRWSTWVNVFASKLLSTTGLIFAYFVYFAMMETLKKELGIEGSAIDFDIPPSEETMKNIVYLVIIITGAMAIGTAPALIANLISDQAGRMAAEDAQAIDSDIKWGTMLGAKTFGVGMKIAKGIIGGTGSTGSGSGGALSSSSGSPAKLTGNISGSSAYKSVKAVGKGLISGGVVGGAVHGVSTLHQARLHHKQNKYESAVLASRNKFYSGTNLTGKEWKKYGKQTKWLKKSGNEMTNERIAQLAKNEAAKREARQNLEKNLSSLTKDKK